MWGCGCQQLEDIPARLGWERAAAARGSRAADDLSGALIPGESLEDDGTADHVASKANGTLAILYAHRTVCGEAAVAPGEEVVDDRLADQLDQLQALGEARREAEESGSVHPSALLAIRLFALTGMRRSEVLGHESRARRGELEGLRWGDVQLEAGTITLRDSKTGAQTRVIGEATIDLLRAALPEDAQAEDPVCPGKVPGRPFVGIDRPRIKLFEAAGLANVPGVDLHSLRHTFASVGAHVQNGRFAAFVAPLLGHGYQKRSITERYIHSNPEALRPAADAISGTIASTLGLAESARVIAFKA